MRKNVLVLIPIAAALVLEILPYGAVCNFGYQADDGTIAYMRSLYSYFDLLPFGYGNFAPFLTAVLTCVILALAVVSCFTGSRRILLPVKVLLCVGIVLSLCPLLFGIEYFSAVGALITASLIAEFLWLYFASKREKETT